MEGPEGERGRAYLLESLLSEGHLTYQTVAEQKPRRIYRPGPSGLITTTTLPRMAGDMENRLFGVTIADTPDQTKRIQLSIATDRSPRTEAELAPWHALQ